MLFRSVDGEIKAVAEPALTALNMRLRDDYSKDCQGGVNRWNQAIKKHGVNFELKLPSTAFHRQIGEFQNVKVSPEGQVISDAEWIKNRDKWLPSTSDGEFVASLMKPCWERGQYASWVSAPKTGIDGKAGDFEYVSIHRA